MKEIILGLILLGASNSHGLTFNNNVPESIKKVVLSDLQVIYSFQGQKASPLHEQIFGRINGADYQRFFESHISEVKMGSCGGGIACIYPTFNPDVFILGESFNPGYVPQIARISWYFNVARRNDSLNNFWLNVNCPVPFLDENGNGRRSPVNGAILAGTPNCDDKALGGYGITAILLENISNFCENCTLRLKEDAHIFAMDALTRIIDSQAHQTLVDDLFRLTRINSKPSEAIFF